MSGHVCTCGDCAIDVFVDHCKFEAAAERLAAALREKIADGVNDTPDVWGRMDAALEAYDALFADAPAAADDDTLSDPAQLKLGPFARDSETSRQAALANYPRQGTQRHRILDIFTTGRGMTLGFTREEIAGWLGLPDNTVRPRVRELIDGGWVEQGTKDGAAATRKTKLGNESEVLMLTPGGAARLSRSLLREAASKQQAP